MNKYDEYLLCIEELIMNNMSHYSIPVRVSGFPIQQTGYYLWFKNNNELFEVIVSDGVEVDYYYDKFLELIDNSNHKYLLNNATNNKFICYFDYVEKKEKSLCFYTYNNILVCELSFNNKEE